MLSNIIIYFYESKTIILKQGKYWIWLNILFMPSLTPQTQKNFIQSKKKKVQNWTSFYKYNQHLSCTIIWLTYHSRDLHKLSQNQNALGQWSIIKMQKIVLIRLTKMVLSWAFVCTAYITSSSDLVK